jgi:putative membrane protein
MNKTILSTATLMAAMAMACPAVTRAEDEAAKTPASANDTVRGTANQAQRTVGDATDRAESAAAKVAGQASSTSQQSMSKDQRFAMKAASGDMLEIQLGQLAQQKSQNPQVKQLAQMLVKDHTQSSQMLMQVAQQANMQLPKQLMPVHQAMLQEMQQLEGQDFDMAFLHGQAADHLKMVLMFRDAQQQLQNPQLKQFAMQTLPKLRQHKQMVDKAAGVDQEMSGTASGSHADHGDAATTAGSRQPGSSSSASEKSGTSSSGSDTAGTKSTPQETERNSGAVKSQ